MGEAVLQFKPRESLTAFIKEKGRVSLIRRMSGKKSSKNMVIHGENLATLAALKAGSGTSGQSLNVDLIYIDPPYNVGGNQGYRNVWKGKSEKERGWAGDHGLFLDFMEPRLKIGKSLLSEDGIIFVSICDGEYARLKILMSQIFGEENELATFIWNKGRGSGSNSAAIIHEYILCYAKNKQNAPRLREKKPQGDKMLQIADELLKKHPFDEAQMLFKQWISKEKKLGNLRPGEAVYSEIHPINKRVYRIADSCAQDDPNGKRCKKKLIHPITGKPCPIPKNGWKWSEKTLDRLVREGLIYFGKDHTIIPKLIKYLDEKMYQDPLSVIYDPSDGAKDLPDGITFSTPKPVKLIKHLISLYQKKNATILDFFAGSGATAHAVHDLNLVDGGDRSWIMVEELGSTFYEVLVPRIEYFDASKDYAVYETDTADVSNRGLIKTFQKYSFDYLAAYHRLQDATPISKEGMSVLGIDDSVKRVVAMTIPSLRKTRHFFEEELALLKDAIKKSGATSALIYTVNTNEPHEEPWIGLDKSVLSGTPCKNLQIVEVPEKLVKEWEDVLAGMEAA